MGRKLNVLSLAKKAEIINEAKNGVSITALSKKYNTAKSTICGIVKNENKILECVNNTLSGPGKRKTLRASELPKMEKKLYKWFLLQRSKNYPINGLILKEKAKELHAKYSENGSTFFASDGWLKNLKKRHGIRLISISGEKLSSRPELVEPFKTQFQAKIQELELCPEQI
ncbi:PREDICTED: tigger transposable element-derived protein 2-like [Rhagoletis zephyria]|uniref:tigger transposable element-derived protein 2-like n=1 Tax=Rhagoletis zephyria TaxID=28612 RepID=UPI0008118F04|nr:PREDICTED: tigger transposable element-derived protein 2-like [Rhagoletis zephyria]